jgi:hypothetical protein
MEHTTFNAILDWAMNSSNINWILAGLLGLSEWLGTSKITKVKSLSSVVVKVYNAIKNIEFLEQSLVAVKKVEDAAPAPTDASKQ